MIKGNRISSLIGAAEFLKEFGCQWDRVLCLTITGGLRGPNYYFMQGNFEVGYYTPIFGTILIHDRPIGPWSEIYLNNAEFIWKNV